MSELVTVKPKIIFDTLGIFSESDINRLQQVSKVCVLGRGDF